MIDNEVQTLCTPIRTYWKLGPTASILHGEGEGGYNIIGMPKKVMETSVQGCMWSYTRSCDGHMAACDTTSQACMDVLLNFTILPNPDSACNAQCVSCCPHIYVSTLIVASEWVLVYSTYFSESSCSLEWCFCWELIRFFWPFLPCVSKNAWVNPLLFIPIFSRKALHQL